MAIMPKILSSALSAFENHPGRVLYKTMSPPCFIPRSIYRNGTFLLNTKYTTTLSAMVACCTQRSRCIANDDGFIVDIVYSISPDLHPESCPDLRV